MLKLFLFPLSIKNTPDVVSNIWGAVQKWGFLFL
jgi:hypothetical protein